MTSIDLDEFQKEINQAEYYLQFGSSNAVITHDEKASGPNRNLSSAITAVGLDYADEEARLLDSVAPSKNKYSDSLERENLVNRLLREHQLKSTASSRHYLDDDDNFKDIGGREAWSRNGATIDEVESGSPQVDDDDDDDDGETDDLDDNIIFYASDLQQPTMMLAGSTYGADALLSKRSQGDRSSPLFFGGADSNLYPMDNALYPTDKIVYPTDNVYSAASSNNYPMDHPGVYSQQSFLETTRFDNSNLNIPFSERVYRDQGSTYQRAVNSTSVDGRDALDRDTVRSADTANSKSTDSLEFATTQAWPQPSYLFNQELLGTGVRSREYATPMDSKDGYSRGRTDRRVNQSLRSRVYNDTQSSRSRSTSRDKPRVEAMSVNRERTKAVRSTSPTKKNRNYDNDKSHSSASGSSSSRHLLSREELQHAAEKQFDDDHTFRPNVTRVLSRNKPAQRSTTPTSQRSTTPHSLMRRIDEFNREKDRQRSDWLKQKKLLDDVAMAECTFTPELSKGTYSILKNKTQPAEVGDRLIRTASYHKDPVKASDRLYREAEKRVSQQRFVEKQVYDARMAQYTFQPNLNPHSRTSSNYEEVEKVLPTKPIHERLSDMLREKKRYMQELQAEVQSEVEQELTFHPRIDKNSKSIAERKLLGHNESIMPRISSSLRDNSELVRHNLNRAISDSKLTREQESAIILGFHRDVGSRLLDQGRVISRHKQELLYERDNEIAESLEKAKISKGSTKIIQKTGLDRWIASALYVQYVGLQLHTELFIRHYVSFTYIVLRSKIDCNSTDRRRSGKRRFVIRKRWNE